MSFEARAGKPIKSGSWGAEDGSVRLTGSYDIENLFGAYAKFHPFSSAAISPYGMLGFTHGTIEHTASTWSDLFSQHSREITKENDLSFGLGIDICGEKNARILNTPDFSTRLSFQ